ncbi:MAG: flagellar basal body rod protein FlgB [Candidatus Binatia bacterium]
MAGFVLFSPTHYLLTTSMRVRSARHDLLTANIANADTPGYRPRDLDFAETLQSLGAPREGAPRTEGQVRLAVTHPLHQHREDGSVSEHAEGEEGLDENSVDLDSEITKLVENSLQHEASLTLLSRTLGGLRYAISEGRR